MAGELFANEPIWITDEEVYAVGTSTTTYKEIGPSTGGSSDRNVDGGNASSVFTSEQIIDGGTASG